jgi:hypothetical protein
VDAILGAGNGLGQYAIILVVYAVLFVIMRYAHPSVEPEFRKTFWILGVVWAVSTFVGNYLLSLVGALSFLPWLNNFIHTFIWIGLCLGFLYAGAYRRPLWEQFLLFATFSLLVKAFEHDILRTWELDHFFFIAGNRAYILGWSLADGLYPVLSMIGLRISSHYIKGLVAPPGGVGGGGPDDQRLVAGSA